MSLFVDCPTPSVPAGGVFVYLKDGKLENERSSTKGPFMADPKPLKYVDPTTVDADYEGVAQPVAIYGLPASGGAEAVSWEDVEGKPANFEPAAHTHAADEITSGTLDAARIPNLSASKVNSGTFTVARIPDLEIAKITGLEARLAAIESQLGGG